jgi:hypothetical protein
MTENLVLIPGAWHGGWVAARLPVTYARRG